MRWLSKLFGAQRQRLDVYQFDDDIAATTAWCPLQGGGTNFCTHRLVEQAPERLVFKASGLSLLIPSIFGFVAIACLFSFFFVNDAEAFASVIPVGLAFLLVSLLLFYVLIKPIVFDKCSGLYWKGRTRHGLPPKPGELKQSALLSEVHAIQLIPEWVRGSENSYYSYELNLILRDCQRLNVVDHGSRRRIREDAEFLAQFLGVPVWDAIDYAMPQQKSSTDDMKVDVLSSML